MNLDLGSPAAWWRWLRQWRLNQLVQTCDRVDVLDHVHDNGKLGPRYAFMTVMACGIAILGLLQNSAAVIIGAMLISPLMGPIVELGMGLATFDLRTIRGALKTLAVGIALALAIAMAIVWLSPLKEATGEILARTQPTFFDLLVAVFSGLAGAYATVTRKGETIVGVAIATALMPPLAVVGYGLAVANWNVAGGAAFLFMTNLLAIALSVTIVARLYGFGGSDSPKQTAWQASLIVASFLLLSIPLGLALKRIALQSQAELVVRGTLDRAATAASGRVSGLRVDTAEGRIAVDAVVTLPSHVTGLEAKLQEELKATLKQPVTVRVQEVLTSDDASFASSRAPWPSCGATSPPCRTPRTCAARSSAPRSSSARRCRRICCPTWGGSSAVRMAACGRCGCHPTPACAWRARNGSRLRSTPPSWMANRHCGWSRPCRRCRRSPCQQRRARPRVPVTRDFASSLPRRGRCNAGVQARWTCGWPRGTTPRPRRGRLPHAPRCPREGSRWARSRASAAGTCACNWSCLPRRRVQGRVGQPAGTST